MPALRSLVREHADRYGSTVDLHVGRAMPRLAADAETSLHRVVQEALTNVAKHAHAGKVDVALDLTADCVELEIRDDGQGFDPHISRTGLGLTGIRERVQLPGGRLDIASPPTRAGG